MDKRNTTNTFTVTYRLHHPSCDLSSPPSSVIYSTVSNKHFIQLHCKTSAVSLHTWWDIASFKCYLSQVYPYTLYILSLKDHSSSYDWSLLPLRVLSTKVTTTHFIFLHCKALAGSLPSRLGIAFFTCYMPQRHPVKHILSPQDISSFNLHIEEHCSFPRAH